MAAENGMHQAKSSTALDTKTRMLLNIKSSIDSLVQNHPKKSFMGGIKSSCDD
jgi:hypothetical protein